MKVEGEVSKVCTFTQAKDIFFHVITISFYNERTRAVCL